MTKLREQMKMNLELKGYSSNTRDTYIRCVKNYAEFFNQSPDKMGTEEIKKYLHYLITDKAVSKSYVNIVYSALKFFYTTTLKSKWDLKAIPRVKTPKKLPVVLSTSEVKAILESINNLKHRTILTTIYAAGLRISEAANLKIKDIDSNNMQIRVRQGKGMKDRYTILSEENLKLLRDYWKQYGPLKDWLFEGVPQYNPISTRSIQKVFERARNKAGIKKDATVHTLRHCFATHLIESGVGTYHVQKLLGHSSPQTTNKYIHLTRQDILKIKSPFDLMGDR